MPRMFCMLKQYYISDFDCFPVLDGYSSYFLASKGREKSKMKNDWHFISRDQRKSITWTIYIATAIWALILFFRSQLIDFLMALGITHQYAIAFVHRGPMIFWFLAVISVVIYPLYKLLRQYYKT